jgi:hypothetical protein
LFLRGHCHLMCIHLHFQTLANQLD